MRTDTIRRDIVLNCDAFEKQDLYEDIKTVLSILQMRNNSVLNAHQTLKTADTDKLIKQYLYGFDGVLEHILSELLPDQYNTSSLNETEIKWTRTAVAVLKTLVNGYRSKYMDSILEAIDQSTRNVSMRMVFREFVAIQNKSQRFTIMLESLGMIETVCSIKLMMPWVVVKIRLPGILMAAQPDLSGDDFKRLWGFLESDFMACRCLMISLSQYLSADQIKIQSILQSIDGAPGIIDDLIVFVEELRAKFLTK